MKYNGKTHLGMKRLLVIGSQKIIRVLLYIGLLDLNL